MSLSRCQVRRRCACAAGAHPAGGAGRSAEAEVAAGSVWCEGGEKAEADSGSGEAEDVRCPPAAPLRARRRVHVFMN